MDFQEVNCLRHLVPYNFTCHGENWRTKKVVKTPFYFHHYPLVFDNASHSRCICSSACGHRSNQRRKHITQPLPRRQIRQAQHRAKYSSSAHRCTAPTVNGVCGADDTVPYRIGFGIPAPFRCKRTAEQLIPRDEQQHPHIFCPSSRHCVLRPATHAGDADGVTKTFSTQPRLTDGPRSSVPDRKSGSPHRQT